MIDFIKLLKEIKENFSVATIIWSKSGSEIKVGDKILLTESGKVFGNFESSQSFILNHLRKSINNSSSFLVSYSSCDVENDSTCGTKYQAFIEYYGNFPKIHIFGAGDIGKFVHKLLRSLSINSFIYDDSQNLLNDTENSYLIDYKNLKIKFSTDDYIVIVTRGHKNDYDVLKYIFDLKQSFKYIGLLGSKTKNDILKDSLFEKGYTIKYWEQVKTPIGLDIVKARTPSEIAIAIVAEILSVKNGGGL